MPVEAEVAQFRAPLEASAHAQALAAGRRLERRVPENRDVLYMIAVAQRHLGGISVSLATLESRHCDYAQLHQERSQACP